MRSFADNTGRAWTIDITVSALKRVRALCGGFELAQIIDFEGTENQPDISRLKRLTDDPILLVDVLYSVCKPEADNRNISDEEFGRALTGDAIEAATIALIEGMADFFPAAKRQIVMALLNRGRRFAEEAREKLPEVLEQIRTLAIGSNG